MTKYEETLLRRLFPSISSVSLFGNYRQDHEQGVDVRDLSRYAAGTVSGVFGCLLFDYVPELEQAFSEAFRVLVPGGVLFSHIAPYRLSDGVERPVVKSTIVPRAGYFEYVPTEDGLPSIEVGREWLVSAMGRAGFECRQLVVQDVLSGEMLDWFIGLKPRLTELSVATLAAPYADRGTGEAPSERRLKLCKTYSISVDPAFGFKRVVVELDVPSLPGRDGRADFAEHVWSSVRNESTPEVIACSQGSVTVSRDLGDTWEAIETPDSGNVRLWNSFTTASGVHLIQGAAPPGTGGGRHADENAPIFVFDSDWHLVDRVQPGDSPWHGTRAIAQAGNTIMYGEYPSNSAIYSPGFADRSDDAQRDRVVLPSRVFRSRDDGRTWETVLEQSWREVRHFHTVVADPHRTGRWLASSGDRPQECIVWESLDDGDAWTEVTGPTANVALHSTSQGANAQSVFRYTDIVVRRDEVIWGSDDWLGTPLRLSDDVVMSERVGSRLFRAPRETPWAPETIGYVGNPVRSIIDVGEAFVVASEAKTRHVGFCPQVLLLSRSAPYLLAPLFLVDNFGGKATGFTYARASRAARDGVFFSYRLAQDGFPTGARILRWRVSFD